jgi:putative transposase
MARLPRLALAGHLHHLVLRGNAGQALFVDDEDRQRCLQMLREALRLHGVALHGYVLLEDSLQLLLTPDTDAGLSAAMQALGRRYVAAFNRRHGRSGTLWEGRYRATVAQPQRHFIPLLTLLEWQPQRLGLAASALEWPWSSAAHHLGRRRDPLVTDHPLFWATGNTPFERELAHRARLEAGLSEAQARSLMDATLKGWALGDAAFLAALAARTERPVQPRPRGRPRKTPAPAVVPPAQASHETASTPAGGGALEGAPPATTAARGPAARKSRKTAPS